MTVKKKAVDMPGWILAWLPNTAPAMRDALVKWAVLLEEAVMANAERFSAAEWECLYQYLGDVEIEPTVTAPRLILADSCGDGELAKKVRELDYAGCWGLLHALARRREKGGGRGRWWTPEEVRRSPKERE